MGLERLLVSKDGMGLVTATPLQRAICRIIDGRALGDLMHHPDVITAIGPTGELPKERPEEIAILSGARTAKSLIVAAVAIRATQICDMSKLGKGEIPRYSIVSLQRDLADVVFGHIVGNILAQPILRTLLAEKPTADSVLLRQASTGRNVEIKVVAGARSGGTVVSRWSAGMALDEFPRMLGQEEGIVNADDMRAAVLSRLLPGAQIMCIGSPWAPFGPAHKMAQEHWKKPTKKLVFIWADARKLNPVWWTPERVEALKDKDPDAYRTDVLAQFLEPEELFFSAEAIEKARVQGAVDIPPIVGHTYVAAIDPATRSNAWTLTIGTRNGDMRRVVLCRQWRPGLSPLDPRQVFEDIERLCEPYGITKILTDQWSIDAMRAVAADFGLALIQQTLSSKETFEAYSKVKHWFALGQLQLVDDPELADDLKRVRRRVIQTGVSIKLPQTADGRHCDYAPAIVRCLTSLHDDYANPAPAKGTVSRAEWEMKQQEEREDREIAKRKGQGFNWWEREYPRSNRMR